MARYSSGQHKANSAKTAAFAARLAKNGGPDEHAPVTIPVVPDQTIPVVPAKQVRQITVTAPDIRMIETEIVGTAPLMLHRFTEKARRQMEEKQRAGSTAKKGTQRVPKDFEQDFQQARYISVDGWDGFPAGGIRRAMISACKLVNFRMSLGKLSIFVAADGLDKLEKRPLIRIHGGPPQLNKMPARNDNGSMDIRVRPLWEEWSMRLRLRYDADQFTAQDVVNLLMRVGIQVGLGEGRHDSRESCGIGFGTFDVVQDIQPE